MKKLRAAVAILALLGTSAAAQAQAPGVRGHVVVITDSDVIVQGEDGRTYTVNTTGMDSRQVRALEPGHAVGVATRGAGPNGVLIGSTINVNPAALKAFARLDGTVLAVSGSRVTFEGSDGNIVLVDLPPMVGRAPAVELNTPATLIYESGPRGPIAVWIEGRRAR